jgi:hypothetical protein
MTTRNSSLLSPPDSSLSTNTKRQNVAHRASVSSRLCLAPQSTSNTLTPSTRPPPSKRQRVANSSTCDTPATLSSPTRPPISPLVNSPPSASNFSQSVISELSTPSALPVSSSVPVFNCPQEISLSADQTSLLLFLPHPPAWKCSLCTSVLKASDSNEKSLMHHLKKQHNLAPRKFYKCRFCPLQNTSSRGRKVVHDHVNSVHAQSVEESQSNVISLNNEASFVCDICNEKQWSQNGLAMHYKRKHDHVSAASIATQLKDTRLQLQLSSDPARASIQPVPAAPTGATSSLPEEEEAHPVQVQEEEANFNEDWRNSLLFNADHVGSNSRLQRFADLFREYHVNEEWSRIESIASEIIREIKPEGTSARQPHQRARQEPTNAADLQRMYQRDRKRVTLNLLNNRSPPCGISRDDLTRYFQETLASPDISPEMASSISEVTGKWIKPYTESHLLLNPITADEVVSTLKGLHQSSPGEDGVMYRDLLSFDESGSILAHLYSECKKHQRVPLAWKSAVITLVHKKGDVQDCANWRPIALSNTIYKVYTKLWSNRLLEILKRHLSTEQKGFMPTEGCAEHITTLNILLQHARQHKRSISLAFIDLKNAFGSVPHELIIASIEKMGLPEEFAAIVKDLYNGSSCKVRCQDGLTDPIEMGKGVKQGDPLSALLFNIAIEPVIQMIKQKHRKAAYEAYGQHCNILAYADDLVLIASSANRLQIMLNDIQETFKCLLIESNPGKCATLTLTNGRLQTNNYKLGECTLPTLSQGEFYTYLGTPIGISINSTPTETLTTAMTDLFKIFRSELTPVQKLDATKTFIIPRLPYLLQHTRINRAPLEELDKALKNCMRKTFDLPSCSTVHHLHSPTQAGGLGILGIVEELDVHTVAQGFKSLTSPIALTRDLAWGSLIDTVRTILQRDPSNEDLSNFLMGSLSDCRQGNFISNQWTRLRFSARALGKKIGLKMNVLDGLILQLSVHTLDEEEAVIDKDSRDQTTRCLRQATMDYHTRCLFDVMKSQGKVMPQVAKDPASSQFMRTGRGITLGSMKWIHSARLNVLPLNAAPIKRPSQTQGPSSTQCRRCGYAAETIPHVLCHCPVHMGRLITTRHNDVLSQVYTHLYPLYTRTIIDKRTDLTASARRPDLVLLHDESKRAAIIDITCTYEGSPDAYANARAHKRIKYMEEARALVDRGYDTICDAIVVGVLGTWDPYNNVVLKTLGLSKQAIKKLKHNIIKNTMEYSRRIYLEHLLGTRYFLYNRGHEFLHGTLPLPTSSSPSSILLPLPSFSFSTSIFFCKSFIFFFLLYSSPHLPL